MDIDWGLFIVCFLLGPLGIHRLHDWRYYWWYLNVDYFLRLWNHGSIDRSYKYVHGEYE